MAARAPLAALNPARDESPQGHHDRLALSDAKHRLRKSALKLVGYLVAAYLVLRLVPTLKQGLHSLEHVSWEWLVAAIAIEVLSETGFVIAWRGIVDHDHVLERDGRGRRMDQRVAWAQLGGGLLIPGGSLGVERPRGRGHLIAWVCPTQREGCGVHAEDAPAVPGGVPS